MFEVNKEKIERVLKILKILSSMKRQIISLPYFSQEEIISLIDCCSQFKFREATPLTKTGVVQDFSVCFPAPKVGALKKCIDHFNLLFADPKLECFFSSILNFNDIAVQKYKKGSSGIGIHRDGRRYRDIVLIFCLSGQSDFFITQSRDGSSQEIIDDTPGRLIMMAGPGFRNLGLPENRMLHGVKNVKRDRLSIGLRCDSTLK